MSQTNAMKTENLIVVCESESCFDSAKSLAEKLNVALYDKLPEKSDLLVLRFSEKGLSLLGGGEEFIGDFSRTYKRLKPENLNGELLVRACKIKNFVGVEQIVDATAGLGEDAFLLAGFGFSVTLFERDPVISALLKDALLRAQQDSVLSSVVSRMSLVEGDSLVEIPKLTFQADVILLDPMFPERRKSSLIKKKFQLLQQLERPCSDETELLDVALKADPQRIVVKRPLKGPFLGGKTPSFSIKGNSIRYDCIVPPKLT